MATRGFFHIIHCFLLVMKKNPHSWFLIWIWLEILQQHMQHPLDIIISCTRSDNLPSIATDSFWRPSNFWPWRIFRRESKALQHSCGWLVLLSLIRVKTASKPASTTYKTSIGTFMKCGESKKWKASSTLFLNSFCSISWHLLHFKKNFSKAPMKEDWPWLFNLYFYFYTFNAWMLECNTRFVIIH